MGERRKDLEWAAALRADFVAGEQRRRLMQVQLDGQRLHEPRDRFPSPRLGRHSGMDFRRAGFGDESGQLVLEPAPPQHQRRAARGKVGGKGRQTVVQPPARGAAKRPGAGRLVVEDEHRQHRPAGGQGRLERRIVAQA